MSVRLLLSHGNQIHRSISWEACLPGATVSTRRSLNPMDAPLKASLSSWCCAARLGLARPAWPGNLSIGPVPREQNCCWEVPLRVAAICRFNRWWKHSGCGWRGENSLTDKVDEIWLSPLSQLLPELRQHHPKFIPRSCGISSPGSRGQSQAQLYEPLVQSMLALAKQAPLVLFIDDLQWADSATLDLLQYAIRRWQDNAARILFLASLRSDALHPMTQPQPGRQPAGLEPVAGTRGA